MKTIHAQWAACGLALALVGCGNPRLGIGNTLVPANYGDGTASWAIGVAVLDERLDDERKIIGLYYSSYSGKQLKKPKLESKEDVIPVLRRKVRDYLTASNQRVADVASAGNDYDLAIHLTKFIGEVRPHFSDVDFTVNLAANIRLSDARTGGNLADFGLTNTQKATAAMAMPMSRIIKTYDECLDEFCKALVLDPRIRRYLEP